LKIKSAKIWADMAEVWSFNTTVRNPDRIFNFLKILKTIEGTIFDESGQKRFFAEQIKQRYYKPTKKTLADPALISSVYSTTGEEIPDNIIGKIVALYHGEFDAAARGRATAGILNRFGLCVAAASQGPVKITDLGNKWLKNKISDQELFFKFLLKWQYPNEIEEGYASFNIKPFIGSILLIREVNLEWTKQGHDPLGVSRQEFAYFFPSLTAYSQLKDCAKEIIKLRLALKDLHGSARKSYLDRYYQERTHKIFPKTDSILTKQRDLKDYGDSAIRYFRMSGFIIQRGKGNHVDLSPDRKVEIRSLINSSLIKVRPFDNYEDYLTYLVDSNLPKIPWENDADLKNIKQQVVRLISSFSVDLNIQSQTQTFIESIKNESLKSQVAKIEEYKNILQIKKLRSYKYNSDKLLESIRGINGTLSDRTPILTTRPSLDLEWFTSISLMVLNDAKEINPSYTIGDDGLPTGFSNNISDISCLYLNFGMTVEVTLQSGRDQWILEGQPVMRHLRDFEGKYLEYGDNIYCLFIAKYLHRDTLNTFWNSIRGIGYEGRQQKIIPLTIDQYVKILTYLNEFIKSEHKPTHVLYKQLLEKLYEDKDRSVDVYQWIGYFDRKIGLWYEEIST
jgi:hypothetical protein